MVRNPLPMPSVRSMAIFFIMGLNPASSSALSLYPLSPEFQSSSKYTYTYIVLKVVV